VSKFLHATYEIAFNCFEQITKTKCLNTFLLFHPVGKRAILDAAYAMIYKNYPSDFQCQLCYPCQENTLSYVTRLCEGLIRKTRQGKSKKQNQCFSSYKAKESNFTIPFNCK